MPVSGPGRINNATVSRFPPLYDVEKLTIILPPFLVSVRTDPAAILITVPANVVDVTKHLVPRDPLDYRFASLGKTAGKGYGSRGGEIVCLVGPLRSHRLSGTEHVD